jgi:multidrug resistance efflux pump
VQSLRLPERGGAQRGRAWLPWTLCLVLAATTAWLGFVAYRAGAWRASDESEAKVAPASAGGGELSAAAATPSSSRVVLESKGYVIATHQILVSPKVSGMVTKVTFEEGSRIKKGDVLAQIEDVEYRTDYQKAVAARDLSRQQLLELERGSRPEEIAQARAQLQESTAQLETLEADWHRIQQLRQKNVATAQDYDQAQSKYKAMQKQVERLRFAFELMETGPRQERIEAARADLRNNEANVEKARWKLDNCTIRSPITGTILKKNAEEGNLVNSIAFSGSVSLCEMADLSDLEVDLTVQERDIARVFKGQRCKIRAEAFPDRTYDGVVSRLMPIADRSKGAIPVRVKLTVPREEEGVYLKPEMGATVTFYADQRPPDAGAAAASSLSPGA